MEKHDLSKVTVMGNPESLQKKISEIRLAGPSKLQVIADFDATLTRYWINGSRGRAVMDFCGKEILSMMPRGGVDPMLFLLREASHMMQ